tara:strand:+ start:941 stop:2080 length:1140 start_codon:yes stop_codon:yes gene_type:complete
MSQKYVVNDNKVYQVNDNKLFTTYDELEVPEHNITPVWKGAKIPLIMWHNIVKFCKHSYDELKSETLIYLFYDEDAEQPWSWWVPPQTTAGMTVKSDPDHPDYATQRAKFPDTMFGTVHHHCSTSAFQSGTDEADETKREGLHFTVGNLNKDNDFDVHFRMTIGNNHCEIDAHTYIEMEVDPFKRNTRIPKATRDHIRTELHKKDITRIDTKHMPNFTDEMANVSKSYTVSASKKQPALGSWYDEPYYYTSSKKNADEDLTSLDVAEEFVQAILLDTDYEKILTNYYSYRGNTSRIQLLAKGVIYDAQIAEDLYESFTDMDYARCKPQYIQERDAKVTEFLQEQKSIGLDFTETDLIYGLSHYDEERVGIQPLDTEATI